MGIRWIARSLAVAAVVSIALLAPPLFGQDGAPELSAVTVSATDGATVVQIRTQGSLDAAVISDFSTASPPTVVIDMMGVDAGDVGAVVGGASTLVESVEVKQLADGSVTTVRVFLREQASYSLVKRGDGVELRLKAGSMSDDPLAAALAGSGGGGAGGSDALGLDDQANRGLAAGAVSGPSAVGGLSMSSLDFENKDTVSRVVIGTTAAVDFTSSQPEPNLIVVDLPGATLPTSLERVLDASSFISPVRMVRAYRTRDGVRVAISLRRTTDWKVVAGPDSLLYVDLAVPADMQQDRATAKQGFSTVAPGGDDGGGLKGAYTSETLIGESGRTSDPQSAFGAGRGSGDPASIMGGTGVFMSESGGASTSGFTGQRINIDLVDADIHSVFRLISHVSRLNIVAGDDVKGSVTVRLEDVPWDQALAAILQAKGLGAQRFGNIVRIAPIEIIKAEQQAAVEAQASIEQLTPLKLLVVPLNYAQADDLSKQVTELVSSRGSVQVESRSNQLIIQETEERLAQIRELIRHLDKPTPQVLIEARVVEATSSFSKELGIQWGGELNASGATGAGTGLFFPNSVGLSGGKEFVQAGNARNIFFTPGTDNLAVDLPAAASFGSLALSLGSLSGLINIDVRLMAMESEGYGEVISSPKVLTLDNVAAQITQGARIPFLSTSAGGTQVQFITAALEMDVTPHITSDGKVFMKLSITNNRPDFSQAVQGQPAIQIKEASGQFLIDDGDTVVIGGVYTSSETVSNNRVPLLHRIPLLGYLFKNFARTIERNEMLVFVTPRIVNRSR